jgi:hypothetical protein
VFGLGAWASLVVVAEGGKNSGVNNFSHLNRKAQLNLYCNTKTKQKEVVGP